MENQSIRYQSKDLGHLGLVAGMCHELGLIEQIDQRLPPTDKSVSHGTAVVAMILNGLGFVSQTLYLVPHFFRDKPLSRLLRQEVSADELNDDSLGRTLDAIFAYGASELYSQLAVHSAQHLGLQTRFGHLDSTSFHVDGQYNSAWEVSEENVIHITQGYSRDHRQELNQVMLNLIVEAQASIPLHMEAASGNRSDKESFGRIVKEHCENLKNRVGIEYMIADSAFYTQRTIQQVSPHTFFISRVPSTLSLVQQFIEGIDVDQMQILDANHRYEELGSLYGGVPQRWMAYHSQEAEARSWKTLKKKLLKESQEDQKRLKHLCAREFACEADARHHFEKSKPHFQWTQVQFQGLEEVHKYGKGKVGKPRKQELPETIVYKIQADLRMDLAPIDQARKKGGIFVLATNQIDPSELSPKTLLKNYKNQSKVERGFRFLKDPYFFTSSLFLKKPQRITALMMIMTLCLLVYAALEHRIRGTLLENQETYPDQKGKPSNRPTARWVFSSFKGIHVLYLDTNQTLVLNMKPHHSQLLRLLGPPYQSVYS